MSTNHKSRLLRCDPSTCRFRHLFHNLVPDPAQRQRPANVDELKWREVGAARGAEYRIPVHVLFFSTLEVYVGSVGRGN